MDMDEFPPPSNSHKTREQPSSGSQLPEHEERMEKFDSMQKRLDKIVAGDVIRQKKPITRRIREWLIGDSSQSVLEYVLVEVLIPAAKDAIADATIQGVEHKLFGDERRHSRKRSGRRNEERDRLYVDYRRYSSSRDDRPPFPKDRDRLSKRARANHDFDEIILATRAEALEVVDRLSAAIDKYDSVTVADLYELLGLDRSYTDIKWGWTDLRSAGVRRVGRGYLLDLPRPEPLD